MHVACDLQLFSVQQSPAAEGLTLKGENMQGGMVGGLSRESTAHGRAARLVKESRGGETEGMMGDAVGNTSSIGEGIGTSLAKGVCLGDACSNKDLSARTRLDFGQAAQVAMICKVDNSMMSGQGMQSCHVADVSVARFYYSCGHMHKISTATALLFQTAATTSNKTMVQYTHLEAEDGDQVIPQIP